MGCDIHAYVEYKIDDRWEHVGEVDIYRSYELFGKMVKGHFRRMFEDEAIQEKGIPDDINPLTYLYFKEWDLDAHTPSWLSEKELKNPIFEGCLWELITQKYIEITSDLPPGKIRLVFWFDN